MKITAPIEIELNDKNVAKITVHQLIEMLECKGIPHITVGGDLIDTTKGKDYLVPNDRKKKRKRISTTFDRACIVIITELVAMYGDYVYGDH